MALDAQTAEVVWDHTVSDLALGYRHTSGEILWRHSMTTRQRSAALTTGGGLVVGADTDRYLYFRDTAAGDVLFQTRLPGSVQGFPITYAVGERRYFAVPVGGNRSNAGYVFALPEPAAGR